MPTARIVAERILVVLIVALPPAAAGMATRHHLGGYAGNAASDCSALVWFSILGSAVIVRHTTVLMFVAAAADSAG